MVMLGAIFDEVPAYAARDDSGDQDVGVEYESHDTMPKTSSSVRRIPRSSSWRMASRRKLRNWRTKTCASTARWTSSIFETPSADERASTCASTSSGSVSKIISLISCLLWWCLNL